MQQRRPSPCCWDAPNLLVSMVMMMTSHLYITHHMMMMTPHLYITNHMMMMISHLYITHHMMTMVTAHLYAYYSSSASIGFFVFSSTERVLLAILIFGEL
jgi:hypothetical protein